MGENVLLQGASLFAGIVTLSAFERLFPWVDEEVLFQVLGLCARISALWTCIFRESQYMLGSQEKILEPKVNVKFFTVHPYTLFYRVSRPFLIWSIWQIWPLLGQKNMFFGGLVNWGNEIWIVFGWFQGFLGHQNDFWKFQKLSKFLT